jgi:hypothetical protein
MQGVFMTDEVQRGGFALLCVLCAIAITTGGWIEMARVRRGESLLAPRHFRVRLLSAAIWVFALLSLAGAVTIWWPKVNATFNQRLQSFAILNGAFCLIVVALLLLVVDMWMLASARRKVEREQTLRFSEQLRDLAEKETVRLRAEQTVESKKVRVYAPDNGIENGHAKPEGLDQSSRNGLLDSSE